MRFAESGTQNCEICGYEESKMDERSINKLLREMTLEEKAGLCSGLDFWQTKSIERLGIPSIMVADGPHGLRKQAGDPDHLGLNGSIPATCFPTASALASSWNRALLRKVGAAIAEECLAENISVILGPGGNSKRSPLCGRNFEYFSEDPYLSSEMACEYIQGTQSMGVGTSLKHYAVNNQETRRLVIDAEVDERSLREIYLASFERAVKNAKPWTVMCAYNKVNGTYCSENQYLLTDILRDEWGYEGIVVSDWGAVNDRVRGLLAGLDLEMPGSNGERDSQIAEAVRRGEIPEHMLDQAVKRILKIVFMAEKNRKPESAADLIAHHALAREAARESIVLLKNEDGILPLKKEGTLAVIGGFAKQPRFEGGGSSHVNAAIVESPYGEIESAISDSDAILLYAQGYRMDGESGMLGGRNLVSVSDVPDDALIAEAVKAAKTADIAVIFAGLPDSYESEGVDRKTLCIPGGHRALIERVAEVQKNVVVVLNNGAPIEMPWIDDVKAVLEGYLCGQAFGGAVSDILFGSTNPCGKLAETFPVRLSDNPSYLNFPGNMNSVEYREGIFVGYRYYDAKEVIPLFPFGYGLSYTSFAYTRLAIDKREVSGGEGICVRVTVKNTGSVFGKEIIQLYVRDIESSVIRPVKELKGFEKVGLDPGEEREIVFMLDSRAFAFYDTDIHDWRVENGDFEILVGKSSAEIVLRGSIKVLPSATGKRKEYSVNSTLDEIIDGGNMALVEPYFKGLFDMFGCDGMQGIPAIFREMPLRTALIFSPGGFHFSTLDEVLAILNARRVSG